MRLLSFLSILLFTTSPCVAKTAVLYTGDDWCEAGELLTKEWKTEEFIDAVKIKTELFDVPEKETNFSRSEKERLKFFYLEIDRFPALAVFDENRNCIGLRQGLPFYLDRVGLKRNIEEILSRYDNFLLKNKNFDKIDTVGSFLEILSAEIKIRDLKKVQPDLWSRLEKENGAWQRRFLCNPLEEETEKIRELKDTGKFNDAEKLINKWLSEPASRKLTVNQRQGLQLLFVTLYKDTPSKRDFIIRKLKSVISMDSNSFFGITALGFLCRLGEGPVSIPYGWREKDIRNGRQTWKITTGIPRAFIAKVPCYNLTFRRLAGTGNLTIQGIKILSGTSTVAMDSETVELKSGDTKIKLECSFETTDNLSIEIDLIAENPQDERGLILCSPALVTRKNVPLQHFEIPESTEFAVNKIGRETVNHVAMLAGGRLFIRDFLNNLSWCETFFSSAPASESFAESFQRLSDLYYYGDFWIRSDEGKRWATALALNSQECSPAVSIQLFNLYAKLNREKRLNKNSKNLNVAMLRFVVTPKQCSPETLEWMSNHYFLPSQAYREIYKKVPYRNYNFFGDSVLEADFYQPWEHFYGWQECAEKVGGVCGALSFFSVAALKSAGLPASSVGQPNHCAYASFDFIQKKWRLNYSISPFSWLHFSLWNSRFTFADLFTKIVNSPAFISSSRLTWQAEAMIAEKSVWRKEIDEMFQRATLEMPNNFDAWQTYGKWLKKCGETVPFSRWENWSLGVATGLNDFYDAAWDLTNEFLLTKSTAKEPEKLLTLLCKIHEKIPLQGSDFESCNPANILEKQIDFFKTPATHLMLFNSALKAPRKSETDFCELLKWGANKFNSDESRNDFLTILKKNHIRIDAENLAWLNDAVLKASNDENVTAFNSCLKIYDVLTQENRALKKIRNQNFNLISNDGLLRLSSTGSNNFPLNYHYVLDERENLYNRRCQTAEESSPSMLVKLKGLSSVASIYIENVIGDRKEYQTPFSVKISSDKKTWHEIFKTEDSAESWRIDLPVPLSANFVKIERTPNAKNRSFQLRKIMIFGKRSY